MYGKLFRAPSCCRSFSRWGEVFFFFFYLVNTHDGATYVILLPGTSAVLLVRGLLSQLHHFKWEPRSLVACVVCSCIGSSVSFLGDGHPATCLIGVIVWLLDCWCRADDSAGKEDSNVLYLFHLIMDCRGRYEPLKPVECFRSVMRPSARYCVVGSQRWIVWNSV